MVNSYTYNTAILRPILRSHAAMADAAARRPAPPPATQPIAAANRRLVLPSLPGRAGPTPRAESMPAPILPRNGDWNPLSGPHEISDMNVRKATSDDLQVMQAIARRTIDRCYRSFLGDEGVDWYIESGESDAEVEKHLDNCDVLVNEDTVVAFAIFFADLIHLMMVDVDFHRRGIGTQLLSHCEDQLFENGNTAIRLETFEGNAQALAFYRKNGWSESKRQEDKEHGFVRVYFEKHASGHP